MAFIIISTGTGLASVPVDSPSLNNKGNCSNFIPLRAYRLELLKKTRDFRGAEFFVSPRENDPETRTVYDEIFRNVFAGS